MTEKRMILYDKAFEELKLERVAMYAVGDGSMQENEFTFDGDAITLSSYKTGNGISTMTFRVEFSGSDLDAAGAAQPEIYVITTDSDGEDTYVKAAYDSETKTWIGTKEYTQYDLPVTLAVSYDQPETSWILDYDMLADSTANFMEAFEAAGIDMDDFYEAEELESEDTLLFRYTPVDGQEGVVPLLVEISFPDTSTLPDYSFRSINLDWGSL